MDCRPDAGTLEEGEVRSIFAILATLAIGLLTGCSPGRQTNQPTSTPIPPTHAQSAATAFAEPGVSGTVVDASGAPVRGASVRVQATTRTTSTDELGRFALVNLETGEPMTISAWAEGHYCAKAEGVAVPADGLVLTLRRYQTEDNQDYTWVPPLGEGSCYSCKSAVTQVWLDHDAHAGSATNARFLSMYNGTDLDGNRSAPTRYAYVRDYGRIPLKPDPSQPYYGPGYKLDFPGSDGNCAACHTPGPAIDAAYGVDPNAVSGTDAYGVHCDFCHKVAEVSIDPESGLPRPNMPGVLSMDIRRPFPNDPERFQLFFGTFDDDNVPEEDTYLPLIEQSEFCAPCHFGVFWDTVVYNSFGEWLDSPYSDPSFEGARTCQQCHMPSPTVFDGEPITNVAPGTGGIERDPSTIHAHTFPGAASQELLQNAVAMDVEVAREGSTARVEVTLTNDRTGHHVPTDSPLRQMILLVQAKDAQGRPLGLIEGPTLPDWCGAGDPAQGDYAGLPGVAYARVLQELWTEIAPTGAYWNPTRVLSDTRLAAFAVDPNAFVFEAPQGTVEVEVTLWFRRAYRGLMDQKGWTDEDILMAREALEVP
jgi:hypothetical protein